MSRRCALVARSKRGQYTESWHFGAVAVMTPDARLVACIGDPSTHAFMRSSAKPLQALPLVMAGGLRELDLSREELAIMCASHAGMVAHTECVEGLLARHGLSVTDLACGAHPPLCETSAAALNERGLAASALHSNCSGNHVGMLLTCRLLGHSTEGYTDSAHPLNRQILELVARFGGLATAEVEMAVDGCGLPTYRVPLAAAAIVWARLAAPEASGLGSAERKAAAAVIEAMAACPEMVAGCGRFTTRLIEATGGRVVGKEGADGFYALAIRGPVAFGAAIKIADGTENCRAGVVLEVLRQLGSLSAEELEALMAFHSPPIINRNGMVVGAVEPDVHLEDPVLRTGFEAWSTELTDG